MHTNIEDVPYGNAATGDVDEPTELTLDAVNTSANDRERSAEHELLFEELGQDDVTEDEWYLCPRPVSSIGSYDDVEDDDVEDDSETDGGQQLQAVEDDQLRWCVSQLLYDRGFPFTMPPGGLPSTAPDTVTGNVARKPPNTPTQTPGQVQKKRASLFGHAFAKERKVASFMPQACPSYAARQSFDSCSSRSVTPEPPACMSAGMLLPSVLESSHVSIATTAKSVDKSQYDTQNKAKHANKAENTNKATEANVQAKGSIEVSREHEEEHDVCNQCAENLASKNDALTTGNKQACPRVTRSPACDI
ncbi:hypothetical protein EKO04_011594 [Ascochyta lentis]|uniref:Uncharacterized protein n=1 Tax=Ascochyta lentis TaxID=205686 RepID=A0A8H7MD65_9PLEO|nr:hypothetical protein EKO04_011594 [Ascochyta lentis]